MPNVHYKRYLEGFVARLKFDEDDKNFAIGLIVLAGMILSMTMMGCVHYPKAEVGKWFIKFIIW